MHFSYSATVDAFEGVASFPIATSGLGSIYLRGVETGGTIMLDSDFALLEAPRAVSQNYYSPDGNAWLHLEAQSLPGGCPPC